MSYLKTTEIDWYPLAYLYAHRGLELHDIVKAVFIFSTGHVIEDERPASGYGILTNKGLFQSMIYAMIVGYPEGYMITQSDMARAMGWNRSTVSRLIKSMVSDGYIAYDRKTSTYTILREMEAPDWIMEFGKAVIELQFDSDMKARFDEDYKDFWFIRGFQVLWDELKQLRPLGRLRPNFSKGNTD